MHDSHGHLSDSLQTGIGLFYFLVMLMNVGFALYHQFQTRNMLQAIIWYVVAAIFGVHAAAYLTQHGWMIFPWLQNGIDYIMGPTTYFVLAAIGFTLLLYFRRVATDPIFAWS